MAYRSARAESMAGTSARVSWCVASLVMPLWYNTCRCSTSRAHLAYGTEVLKVIAQ